MKKIAKAALLAEHEVQRSAQPDGTPGSRDLLRCRLPATPAVFRLLSMSVGPFETDLIGGVEKVQIKLLDYDPKWPREFERHANVIARALGDTALLIEHIGSTSVPGLAAKPIIDILVVVADSTDESAYLPQLEAAGYVLRVREPEWNEHRMFRTPEKTVHVHLYSAGCREIERNLIFRDRLRQNSNDRKTYEQTKRALAAKEWNDMNDYAAAKTAVIEAIICPALNEDRH
jgi:GrpB-like predicted nucleotidyltransferase (UPF0157 family)